MTPLLSPRLKIAAVSAAIFFIGCGAGALNYLLQRTHLSEDLIHDAETAAVSFDTAALLPLTGTARDVDTDAYHAAKRRLQRLKAADPRARYIYLFRAHRDPARVVFLADSTPEGAHEAPRTTDAYPDPAQSPGLQQLIRTGQPSIQGPLRDSFGVSVTAYARIGPPAEPAGDTLDGIGVDIAASDWNRDLWFAAIRGALYVWTLLAFPVFALLSSRRQGEQREAIRNLSEAIEQSHSAIMILDLEHRIEYANRGLCRQLGFGRRELIGRHWRDFIVGPESDVTIADLLATLRTGRAWEGEWTNVRKDGTAYPVHGMVTPVKHRDGTMACFVAIFDDVSDVKRKEAELREARDLAQAGDKAKSHFLATMSHEVRTPLNGIVGFTSLLLETPLTPEQREFVQTIRASGEALIQLTGDILDFARIESGKLKLDPTPCDPRDCIEEALDLHAAKAAEKNIHLLHRAAEDVPAGILVDHGRLRQVLVNLIGNAVKFTERGEVEVTVRRREESGDHAGGGNGSGERVTLEFSIRDTGMGIPAELHGRLFKPFSQLDESSTRRFGGAGLGLAICKNLVQLMGGDISLTSRPGESTVFTFTVRAPITHPNPPPWRIDGMRIGVAAPAGPARTEFVGLLQSWGAGVTTAELPAELVNAGCDLNVVELTDKSAAELARNGQPLAGLEPATTLALVPISLSNELRSTLRCFFRLLINRPIHHGALHALLSGERPHARQAEAAPQFGLHVLIVEDNPVNQRLLQKVLSGLGCTHRLAENGRDAIQQLARPEDRIDVVILDLHMPEMDGLAALERIRNGEAGAAARNAWVIALTADVRPEQRARAFALGLNDYLTKPLRMPELEAALRRFRAEHPARPV